MGLMWKTTKVGKEKLKNGFLVRVNEWTVVPQNNTENIDGDQVKRNNEEVG